MSIPESSNSIFNKQVHPFKQLAVAFGCTLLVMVIMKMAGLATGEKASGYWEIAFAFLMGFALFNSIFSLPYNSKGQYFRDSIFSYMVLAAGSGYMAYLFSGLGVDEAGAYRWLYIVFTFSYLVFISIVNMMRKIIEIVKKQDARLRGEEIDELT